MTAVFPNGLFAGAEVGAGEEAKAACPPNTFEPPLGFKPPVPVGGLLVLLAVEGALNAVEPKPPAPAGGLLLLPLLLILAVEGPPNLVEPKLPPPPAGGLVAPEAPKAAGAADDGPNMLDGAAVPNGGFPLFVLNPPPFADGRGLLLLSFLLLLGAPVVGTFVGGVPKTFPVDPNGKAG